VTLGTPKERFFAIVNPAAGGGRCGRLAAAALDRVRQVGIELEVARTATPVADAESAGVGVFSHEIDLKEQAR